VRVNEAVVDSTPDTTIDNESGRKHYALGAASAVNNMTLGDDSSEAARIASPQSTIAYVCCQELDRTFLRLWHHAIMKRTKRIPICKTATVPVNGMKQVEANGKSICVLNDGERFFACQATCPHESFPLCDGVFDGETLTCMEHLWQWNLIDGGDPRGLAETRLEMYPVEVHGDTVYLKG